jgi:phospholipid-binding lipoprotein MlaA
MRARLARGGISLLAALLVFGWASASLGGELKPAPEAQDRPEAIPEGSFPGPSGSDSDPDANYDPLFDPQEATGDLEIFDPLEGGNRAIFVFNRQVDRAFWGPITKGYRLAVPGPVRRAIRRAFINLNAPVYVVNHLLRLEPLDALETLGAFTMNFSFGMLGFLNAAERGLNIQLKPADLGATLALYGVDSGPYLVIPLLGPTTVRDGLGFVAERAFHPLTYVLPVSTLLMWGGGWGMTYREETWDGLQALDDSSVDPYAVLRSAYTQARARDIEAARRERDDVMEPL